jgi:ribosomal protein S18 acetylase RimI-like enzyme
VSASLDLYRRSIETLLACWAELARTTPGATVARPDGVSCAVFPAGPERTVYNNAVLEPGLAASARDEALDAMEQAYAAAGITGFAAWVHETDAAMQADLERRGYVLSELTRAMAIPLDDPPPAPTDLGLLAIPWERYLRTFELPAGLLPHLDRSQFHLLVAHQDGEPVATALAYDHDRDCGIFNVVTVPHARRRGLGSAVTALHLADARARGCTTASLQATPMAERMYARIGFRDLGRIYEYTRAA